MHEIRRPLLAAGLLLLGTALAVPALRARAEETPSDAPADPRAVAIAAWGRTCRRCHAVPDTRFETDRAFLGQIMETT